MRVGARAATIVIAVVVAGVACARPDTGLGAFTGGFDPTRYDGGVGPSLAGAEQIVRIGIPPYYTLTSGRTLTSMARYLTEEVGVEVVIEAAEDYQTAIDRLAEGNFDAVELSPYALILAEHRVPDLVPLVAAVAQGSSTYASYIVTLRASPLRSLEGARGMRIAYVDKLSTSGFLYPALALKDRGLDPFGDFQVTFAGSHDESLRMLQQGKVDLAAVSSDLLIGNTGLVGPLRILAKAGRIPYDCIAARASLSPAIRERLRSAFLRLSVHSARGREVLESYSFINGFMPVPPHHYDDVRERAQALGDP